MHATDSTDQDLNAGMRPFGRPVAEISAGKRVDAYLAGAFRFHSRAEWQAELSRGEVQVNGAMVKASYKVKSGDILQRHFDPVTEPDANTNIEVIWQDGDVMALYKPSSLPMHENGPYRTKTFAAALTNLAGPDWGAVHRLDRETSGIVLCGRTPRVRAQLSEIFAANKIQKTYLAIVHGRSERAVWTDNRRLGDLADSPIRIKRWLNAEGQEAQTDFVVLRQEEDRSLILAQPKTGRTGQIRIHLAAAGLHLLGDILYYPDEEVFLNWWENGMTEATLAKVGAKRLCLHAYAMQFTLPGCQNEINIHCQPKDDFWQNLDERSYSEANLTAMLEEKL